MHLDSYVINGNGKTINHMEEAVYNFKAEHTQHIPTAKIYSKNNY